MTPSLGGYYVNSAPRFRNDSAVYLLQSGLSVSQKMAEISHFPGVVTDVTETHGAPKSTLYM